VDTPADLERAAALFAASMTLGVKS